MAERRHRRRVCIRASTIVAVRWRFGRSVRGFPRGAWVLAIALPDRAGARRLPAGLHGDGGIDACAYRALRPGRPRRAWPPGSQSRPATGSGACATAPGPGSRSAPSSCSSSPPASTRARSDLPVARARRHGREVRRVRAARAGGGADRPADATDLALLVFTLVASSVAATALGVVQFLGWRIVNALAGRLPAAVVSRPSRLRRALGRRAGRRARRDRAARRGASTGGSRRAAGVAGALGLLVSGSTRRRDRAARGRGGRRSDRAGLAPPRGRDRRHRRRRSSAA